MMSTFLCVLLLGVILVASVQGLTEDQLQQNGKGAPASNDVGWYHKTKTRKDAPASDDVGWYYNTKTRKDAPASDDVGWYYNTKTRKGAPASDDVGWYHKTKTRKDAPASDDVGWYHKTKTRKGAPASNDVGWYHKTKTRKGAPASDNVGWFSKYKATKDAPASDDVGWYYNTKTSKGAPVSDDVGWYHKTKARKGAPASDDVGWFHKTKTHFKTSKDPAPWCQSHISGADCCVQRTMHAHGKTYHLNACVNVDFQPHANEYSVYFSVNGYSLFHKDTDLKMNEMGECFSASQLAPGAKICIKLYKISTKRKRMCAALDGKAVIKGVENKVQLDYGCFQIGSGDQNEDEQVPVGMETEEQSTNAEMFRALSDQLDLSDGGEETTSTEDDTLRF